MVAFFQGEKGADVALIEDALNGNSLLFPPVVLTELLSDPSVKDDLRKILLGFPLIEIRPHFWQRAGDLRQKVLKKKLKARIGDSFIAQFCLDEGIALVTRDADFKNFAAVSRLRINGQ